VATAIGFGVWMSNRHSKRTDHHYQKMKTENSWVSS
jgi:hypothetical protein